MRACRKVDATVQDALRHRSNALVCHIDISAARALHSRLAPMASKRSDQQGRCAPIAGAPTSRVIQQQPDQDGIPDGIPAKPEMKKALEIQGLSSCIWRRGGDSNPRYAINVCLISSQVHSTTLPPLLGGPRPLGRGAYHTAAKAGAQVFFTSLSNCPAELVCAAAAADHQPAFPWLSLPRNDRIRPPDPRRPAPPAQ